MTQRFILLLRIPIYAVGIKGELEMKLNKQRKYAIAAISICLLFANRDNISEKKLDG